MSSRATGDVIEPEHDLIAIGSGGSYAQAGRVWHFSRPPSCRLATIVEKSLNIAADICIYTNRNLTIEEL